MTSILLIKLFTEQYQSYILAQFNKMW